MLALIIAFVLGFVALVIAICGGELKYEKPHDYPRNQLLAANAATLLMVLALACARYL